MTFEMKKRNVVFVWIFTSQIPNYVNVLLLKGEVVYVEVIVRLNNNGKENVRV